MQTKGSLMLDEAKKVRGYFRRPEPASNEQQAEREARIKVLMQSAPCLGCG